MSHVEVRIPDIGDEEGVEVIEICVNVGQSVAVDDPLIVIESDKASMEVPSTASGKVLSIAKDVGDLVDTGDLVLTLDSLTLDSLEDDSKVAAVEDLDRSGPSELPEEMPSPDEPQDTTSDNESELGQTQLDVEVRVPDIGEAKDVTIIEILAERGVSVRKDDPLVVLESDKASMEIVAPVDGELKSVDVSLDEEVFEGSLVAVIASAAVVGPIVDLKADPDSAKERSDDPQKTPTRQQQLKSSDGVEQSIVNLSPNVKVSNKATGKIYAGPAVRRLARELGVDLTQIDGSGTQGRILKDDIHSYVKRILLEISQGRGSLPAVEYPDFSEFGAVELTPLSRMRELGAKNLVKSWLNVVHVTQHNDFDVTGLEQFRREVNDEVGSEGPRLTPLPFVIKATTQTLHDYPQFNASIHPDLHTLIKKKYVNIGLAVDTPEGLIVPVIHDADKKDLRELAAEIVELADAAERRRLRPQQLKGASFTISSLGQLGGTGFTPIINAPEVALLGVAQMSTRPHWNGSDFEPRKMLPLSLSYDHRAINGAEAGRFLNTIGERLIDIRRQLF